MATIEIIRGDITAQSDIDAIVNAANHSLMAGAGVCGAIRSAGGASIFEECAKIVEEKGSCPIGGAEATGAGDLPNKTVVHAVGPIYREYTHAGAEALLASAHSEAVKSAAEAGCRTIAFPAISCGIYGYPVELAAPVAIESALDAADAAGLDTVRFVLFSDSDVDAFMTALVNEKPKTPTTLIARLRKRIGR